MTSFVVPVVGDAHFKQDARQPDRLAAVDQIVREGLALPVGLWAVPGDLYDAGSDVGSRNEWADRVERMAGHAPVVICYGNHDRPGDLYLLSKVKAKHAVTVVWRPQVIDVVTPQGFRDLAKLRAWMPPGVMGWRRVHGGDRPGSLRVTEAQGKSNCSLRIQRWRAKDRHAAKICQRMPSVVHGSRQKRQDAP
ncbi:MAG: metallophosphoesterase [Xanthomonadales bacterium]|nr:metallophosphoesterase [Xanthomonadales bacterium]